MSTSTDATEVVRITQLRPKLLERHVRGEVALEGPAARSAGAPTLLLTLWARHPGPRPVLPMDRAAWAVYADLLAIANALLPHGAQHVDASALPLEPAVFAQSDGKDEVRLVVRITVAEHGEFRAWRSRLRSNLDVLARVRTEAELHQRAEVAGAASPARGRQAA